MWSYSVAVVTIGLTKTEVRSHFHQAMMWQKMGRKREFWQQLAMTLSSIILYLVTFTNIILLCMCTNLQLCIDTFGMQCHSNSLCYKEFLGSIELPCQNGNAKTCNCSYTPWSDKHFFENHSTQSKLSWHACMGTAWLQLMYSNPSRMLHG